MASANDAEHDAGVATARIPSDVRALLTERQAVDLAATLAPAPRRHRVAWRAATRVFGRRYYVAILAGSDNRAPKRIRADGHAMSFLALMARVVLFAAWITLAAVVAALAGVVLIYLVKSHLGIDLMQGPSFLHDYFF